MINSRRRRSGCPSRWSRRSAGSGNPGRHTDRLRGSQLARTRWSANGGSGGREPPAADPARDHQGRLSRPPAATIRGTGRFQLGRRGAERLGKLTDQPLQLAAADEQRLGAQPQDPARRAVGAGGGGSAAAAQTGPDDHLRGRAEFDPLADRRLSMPSQPVNCFCPRAGEIRAHRPGAGDVVRVQVAIPAMVSRRTIWRTRSNGSPARPAPAGATASGSPSSRRSPRRTAARRSSATTAADR